MKYFASLIGKGCSKEEIQTIKNSFSFDLPAAYLEFLELVGKGYGNKSSRFYFSIH